MRASPRTLRVLLVVLLAPLVGVLAAAANCGKIPCTSADPSVCGEGGQCNDATGFCEAAGPSDGACNTSQLATPDVEAETEIVVATLLFETFSPGQACLDGGDKPYLLFLTIAGPVDPAFQGSDVQVSADGNPLESCRQVTGFEATNPTCTGENDCFVDCVICFDDTPTELAVQLFEDDVPVASARCVEIGAGLIDTDCDGVVDDKEAIAGTDSFDADQDADGLPDGLELGVVFCPDETCGCVVDQEPGSSTDPALADTDGDGISDGDEDANGNGVRDGAETDPNIFD